MSIRFMLACWTVAFITLTACSMYCRLRALTSRRISGKILLVYTISIVVFGYFTARFMFMVSSGNAP